jgi:hypothetical protein
MGSITKTETFSAITDILETDEPDGFIATECGRGLSTEKLAFMHRKMDNTETNENRYLSKFHSSLPYTIFTIQTDAEGERGTPVPSRTPLWTPYKDTQTPRGLRPLPDQPRRRSHHPEGR